MEKVQKTSMLYWYPQVKDVSVPQPRTIILEMSKEEKELLDYESLHPGPVRKTEEAIKKYFELPVFIRTDLCSGKHSWEKSCYYDGTRDLENNMLEILTYNLCTDNWFNAWVIREYIEPASQFKAFKNMPIGKERRYFIKNGKVIGGDAYWIEEAFIDKYGSLHSEKLPLSWKKILAKLNTPDEKEIKTLTEYSQRIANRLDGFWSVDFMLAKDGKWYFIDAAEASRSWIQPSMEETISGLLREEQNGRKTV